MRAPQRRRPRRREIYVDPNADLTDLAGRATYVGSPEHKDVPSFAGQPRLRADASCCPSDIVNDLESVSKWLHSALLLGATGAPWEGGFPRYVWHKEGSIVFEGRLVNRTQGWYKGYPLSNNEWPDGIEALYA